MEKKDTKLESRKAKYVGKTLRKKGEKDGKPWKLWELQFDVGRQYPWKVKSFDRLSEKDPSYLQLESLEEGEHYEVVYREEDYTHPQYGAQKSRTAVLIKACSGEEAGQSAKKADVDVAEGWEKFAKEYDESAKGTPAYGNMHMLGAWVANNMGGDFKEVIEKCREHFKK